jgi:hypothetical protein
MSRFAADTIESTGASGAVGLGASASQALTVIIIVTTLAGKASTSISTHTTAGQTTGASFTNAVFLIKTIGTKDATILFTLIATSDPASRNIRDTNPIFRHKTGFTFGARVCPITNAAMIVAAIRHTNPAL